MKSLVALLIVCLPLKVMTVTSPFGWRVHPMTGHIEYHSGIDLRARYDTVYAILNGVVGSIEKGLSLGTSISLQHNHIIAVYGHLNACLVAVGDSVKAGQPVAISGASGRVTSAHLHFSLRYQGHYLNPLNFLYELIKITDHE